jgi:biopolymer transport protein ExbB/TolQ
MHSAFAADTQAGEAVQTACSLPTIVGLILAAVLIVLVALVVLKAGSITWPSIAMSGLALAFAGLTYWTDVNITTSGIEIKRVIQQLQQQVQKLTAETQALEKTIKLKEPLDGRRG